MIVMSQAFVILVHTGFGETHYDLMFERGAVLAVWQLRRSPVDLQPGGQIPAKRMPDHRLEYLSYEGPVSRGRGEVAVDDRGEYELMAHDEANWQFRLAGRRIRGRFNISRHPDQTQWTLSYLGDS